MRRKKEVKPIATALPVFAKTTTATHKLKSFHLNSKKYYRGVENMQKCDWSEFCLRARGGGGETLHDKLRKLRASLRKKQARKNRNGLFRFLCLLFGKLLKQNLISCNIQQVGVWRAKNVKSTKFITKLQVWQMQKCRRSLNCCNLVMASRFLFFRLHHFYSSFFLLSFFLQNPYKFLQLIARWIFWRLIDFFPKTTKGLNLRIVILPEIELNCCH